MSGQASCGAAPAGPARTADLRPGVVSRSSCVSNWEALIATDELVAGKVTREMLLIPFIWRHGRPQLSAWLEPRKVPLVPQGAGATSKPGSPRHPTPFCAELPHSGLCPLGAPTGNSQRTGHPALVGPRSLCLGPERGDNGASPGTHNTGGVPMAPLHQQGHVTGPWHWLLPGRGAPLVERAGSRTLARRMVSLQTLPPMQASMPFAPSSGARRPSHRMGPRTLTPCSHHPVRRVPQEGRARARWVSWASSQLG